jgi:lipopolysaccharide/colanic/teichoic acid biosynthesis glycosyltransferase
LKRLLDIVGASTLLVILALPLAIAALAVRLKLGRPVLFRQQRPGLGAVPFELLKLRTMSNRVGSDGALLPDNQRLDRFGRLLRELSLDELPELINVIKGDMSLVGPRPLLMRYLDRYTVEQARRHETKPGITGWAQINGRNALSWEARFALDVWYVDHRSFWLDLKILAITAWKVVRREGISQPGQATMQEYTGPGS